MTAEEFLGHITQVAFIAIFVSVAVTAVRRRRRSDVHAALFFGVAATIIVSSLIAQQFGDPPAVVGTTIGALLVTMPFLLLMLADDFAGVPRHLFLAAAVGLVAAVVSLYALRQPYPGFYVLLIVAYLLILVVYSTGRFVQGARRAEGAARRRMQAVAVAGGMLALVFAFIIAPGPASVWAGASNIAGMVCGIAYFVGFTPPQFVKQAWQAPQAQRFFASSTLVRRGTLTELVTGLERSISTTMGAHRVAIALWDRPDASTAAEAPPEDWHATVTFQEHQWRTAMFLERTAADTPVTAEIRAIYGARPLMLTPIRIDGRSLGALIVFGEYPPLFADDDMALLRVIGRQVAVLLDDYAVNAELTAIRANEEAMRLKEDFLSSAAHDLKTPLTTLLAQAQLMRRHALREPEQPTDVEGLERIVREALRLRRVVEDLLDAAREDQDGFISSLDEADLSELVAEVVAGAPTSHQVRFEGEPVVVSVDRDRIRQVASNLIENAVKYSPRGSEIVVRVSAADGTGVLTVADHGMGIPTEDLPVIFERFRRGTAAAQGTSAGLGLGLYFCRRIVEEHGGEIAVRSTYRLGSEFEIRLPRTSSPA